MRLPLALWMALGLSAACGARSDLPAPKKRVKEVLQECHSAATASAEPLDAFIMLDSSGSMDFGTSGGGTRWVAVRQGLAAFFANPSSAGLGVSLSFFPIIDNSVPDECSSDATCGEPDTCFDRFICLPSGGGLCKTAEDCAAAGFTDDTCEPTGKVCDNHFTCDAEKYTTPVVPVLQLPDGKFALLKAVDGQPRAGGTPTLPALAGAIAQAKANTQEQPDHKSIVILIGDGLPTACDPTLYSDDPKQAIANLGAVAAGASQAGVQVFVIGVAAPEGGSTRDDLDSIAQAGGTGSAFIITSGAELAADFLDALNQIRITADACVFDVAFEGDFDLRAVRVVVPADGDHIATWRASASECDVVEGGFYYDVSINSGVTPQRVILCPATCGLFGNAPERTVDVLTPCRAQE